jgi:hypothetical protein
VCLEDVGLLLWITSFHYTHTHMYIVVSLNEPISQLSTGEFICGMLCFLNRIGNCMHISEDLLGTQIDGFILPVPCEYFSYTPHV